MQMLKIKTQKGFSLMEVLAAVFVLSVGMLAVIGLQTKTIITSFENRDSIMAAGLAQEGVELVRNIRDTNILNDREAFSGILTSCSSSVDDPDCSGTGSITLKINNNNRYVKNGGTDSIYTRRVTTVLGNSGTSDLADDTLKVTSIVVWKGATFPSDCATCTVSKKCSCSEATFSKWQ